MRYQTEKIGSSYTLPVRAMGIAEDQLLLNYAIYPELFYFIEISAF
ncbi:hypothetical protein FORC066_3770 [Yersinia enterocolitica]|nr:hypothetical protein FORC065_0767 [Yersinia enterocolitica]UXD30977.1 hypothetical protein FORC066_3770 [Yersinia enterocolitica]